MSLCRIGHFDVLEFLGDGGSSAVFRARDHRLHCDVALKIVKDPALRGLLHQEAAVEAQLNHPNIARCFALDEIEVDDPAVLDTLGLDPAAHTTVSYVSQEYVDGGNLEDRIAHGRFDVDSAIEIADQIAAGLEEAHRRGVVHRDLKPANVRITREGRVKILDFGLARLPEDSMTTQGESSVQRMSPQADALVGTPGYIAPEIADHRPGDTRSDLYALGVILYRMLTRQWPFPAGTGAFGRTADGATSMVPFTRHRRDVPKTLQVLVHGLLAHDPDDRVASATRVRQVLAAVAARHGPPPMPVVVRAVAIVLIGVALAWMVAEGIHRDATTPRVYVGAIDDNGACAGLLSGFGEYLSGALAGSDRVEILSPVHHDHSDRGNARDVARALKADFVLEGRMDCDSDRYRLVVSMIRVADGRIVWSGSREGESTEVFGAQAESARGIVGDLEAHLGRAAIAGLRGESTRSLRALRKVTQAQQLREAFDDPVALDNAIERLREASRDDPRLTVAQAELAMAWLQADETRYAPDALDRAEAAARRAVGIDPSSVDARLALGAVLTRRGELDAARPELERALQSSPDDPEVQFRMAVLEDREGDPDASIRRLGRVLDRGHGTWRTFDYLGALLWEKGEYDDARASFERSMQIAPDGVTRPFTQCAALEIETGNVSRALQIYERVPTSHLSAAKIGDMGVAYTFAGRYDRARELFEQAVALDPSSSVQEQNLGDVLEILGDSTAARRRFASAARKCEAQLRADPADAVLRAQYAAMLAKADDCAAASAQLVDFGRAVEWSPFTAYLAALVECRCAPADSAVAAIVRAIELGLPVRYVLDEANFRRFLGHDVLRPYLTDVVTEPERDG